DEGHQCYTATIKTALTQLRQSNGAQADRLPPARYPGNLQYAKVISPADKAVKLSGHWKPLKEMPALQGFLTTYPDAVYTGDLNDSLTIHFKGSYFGIGDILGPTVCARVIISVDGKSMTQNRF